MASGVEVRVLAIGEGGGSLVPFSAKCRCTQHERERRTNVWKNVATADAVGRLVDGLLNPDLVLLTIRCTACGDRMAVTVADLLAK